MSNENVETIRRLYEAMNELGAAGVYALPEPMRRQVYERWFHPDLVIRQSEDLVFDTAGIFHGYEGFVEAARELGEALDALRFDPGDAYEAGNTVVFEVRALATGKGSGVPIELPGFAHLWELRSGRVTRWVVYTTVGEAKAAAGVAE
jgi:ketosteroid isomerase-like protein